MRYFVYTWDIFVYTLYLFSTSFWIFMIFEIKEIKIMTWFLFYPYNNGLQTIDPTFLGSNQLNTSIHRSLLYYLC
jgi:hypothetical protein